MKKMHLAAAVALVLAATSSHAIVAAPACASNGLVANGSFECGNVPADGSWNTDLAPIGWTVSDPSGHGLEFRDNIAGAAQDGHIYTELDGYGNLSISQTLATTAGQTYTFSFWYSDRTGTSADTNGLTYSVGSLSGTIAGGTNATAGNDWHEFVGTFTATGSSTTLTFAGAGTSDSLGTSLDNISVTPVPEPASFALMASGLALLGLARRRRG